MEATAKVLPWTGKQTKETGAPEAALSGVTQFEPLSDALIVMPDEQLEALGSIFAMSPLRKAMTFEGYLVVKGYARGITD
jgi:hypothetical protein